MEVKEKKIETFKKWIDASHNVLENRVNGFWYIKECNKKREGPYCYDKIINMVNENITNIQIYISLIKLPKNMSLILKLSITERGACAIGILSRQNGQSYIVKHINLKMLISRYLLRNNDLHTCGVFNIDIMTGIISLTFKMQHIQYCNTTNNYNEITNNEIIIRSMIGTISGAFNFHFYRIMLIINEITIDEYCQIINRCNHRKLKIAEYDENLQICWDKINKIYGEKKNNDGKESIKTEIEESNTSSPIITILNTYNQTKFIPQFMNIIVEFNIDNIEGKLNDIASVNKYLKKLSINVGQGLGVECLKVYKGEYSYVYVIDIVNQKENESSHKICIKQASKYNQEGLNKIKHEIEFLGEIYDKKNPKQCAIAQYYLIKKNCVIIKNLLLINPYLDTTFNSLFSTLEYSTLITKFHVLKYVARSIRLLQEYGYVHNNIKPSNIVFSKNLITKLIGMSECSIIGTTINRKPENKSIYTSPDKYSEYKTDIYSFGVILWETAFGKVPHIINDKIVFDINIGSVGFYGPIDAMEIIYLLAIKCMENIPEERPNIVDIIFILKSVAIILEILS